MIMSAQQSPKDDGASEAGTGESAREEAAARRTSEEDGASGHAFGTDVRGRSPSRGKHDNHGDAPSHDRGDATSSAVAASPSSNDSCASRAWDPGSGAYHFGPGAYPVHGPGVSIDPERRGNDRNDDDGQGDDEVVFEGFLPEPTPREQAEQMLRSAITLGDDCVRKIVDDDPPNATYASQTNGEGGRGGLRSRDEENAGSKEGRSDSSGGKLSSPIAIIVLTLILVLAMALGVALGSKSREKATTEVSSCRNRNEERYAAAKAIVSDITHSDVLENATSPQHSALEWIACEDGISSGLLESRDPATGLLPAQAHGTRLGNKSGEAQLLRRYALATFYFSTSNESNPWKEEYNFLLPNEHECAWHRNRTRSNFQYGDIDPAGFVCQTCGVTVILLEDDVEMEICDMVLNFRIPNSDIAGTLPPEIGHVEGLTAILLETQEGLHGSLPSTIGNLSGLRSFSVLFTGPDFGGEIPASLFDSPTIEYLTFTHNRGVWRFPPAAHPPPESRLTGITFSHTGLSGALPSYIAELASLHDIDLAGNELEGPIPESLGDLASLAFLSFYDNGMNGTLPDSLGRLGNVAAVVFGRNRIEGTLPSSLGNLDGLRLLDLSHNQLEGTVPAEFSKLASLEHVSLQHNAHLNGPISPFEPLGNLSSLLLYSNGFSSSIPASLFSRFAGQIFADFGHNQFTGKLPDRFVRYAKNTSYLSIMGNNFDADAVDPRVCEESRILHTDCSSCSCCRSCCDGKSTTDNKDPNCYFDLDFYQLTGLECGGWWYACHQAHYDPLPQD